MSQQRGSVRRLFRHLPDGAEAIRRATGDRDLRDYLACEMQSIESSENRKLTYGLLGCVLSAGGLPCAAELESMSDDTPRELRSLAAEVHETYAEGRKLKDVAEVIRGIASVLNVLHEKEKCNALRIARCFSWPAVQRVLLAAIYGVCIRDSDFVTAEEILAELK
jgi:hypothetical protein